MDLDIPEITQNELWIVETTLQERYGEKVTIQEVETEARLSPADRETTECPGMYWEYGHCHFLIIKIGQNRYRSQFFFRIHQQYGTDVDVYEDLTECVITTLQAQADHQREDDDELYSDDNKVTK
ncbi:MAG: hypothetical protein HOM11_03065 [Methylococcales bacterium]|jgi:hypothetical protein|nr:hypothetical protein [Methylococcales bacterium]MBT7445949.1 hypothetical protein [Methylococcales bacterium]